MFFKCPKCEYETEIQKVSPIERPETLEGTTTRVNTGFGKLYITLSLYKGKPFEIFTTIGKSGQEVTAMTEAIGRLVSLWLRSGGDVRQIIKQLKGVGGENPLAHKDDLILSIPDAIGKFLEKK